MSKIKILIADDHPMVAQAIRHWLEREADLDVVGEAANGEEAVRLAGQLLPNVVLMDIRMPNLSGLEATKQIRSKCPTVAVLGLTAHDEAQDVLGILKSGAAGCVLKTAGREALIAAIRSVSAGGFVLDPALWRKLLKGSARHQSPTVASNGADRLTARELDVLRFAAAGMRNDAIAARLGIGIRTVKGHLGDIFIKMGVASRTEAALRALKLGYVRIEDIGR